MEELGILQFISEGALKRHRDHATSLCLREQVLRKGPPRDDRTLIELYRRRTREDTRALYEEAVASASHTLYFSSFCVYPSVGDAFCRFCGGLTSFFHRLCEEAAAAHAFLYIGTDRGGRLHTAEDIGSFLRQGCLPTLALDVCEHAYFLDYGFDRTSYIRAAVGHLDVGRLLPSGAEKETETT